MHRRYITRSQGWRKQASKEPIHLIVDSSSDSYESVKDSLYKPHMPLDCVDSSSDNDDDVGPTSHRRKRKIGNDNDKGKKKAINDEDIFHQLSMDASDYENEVDDDEKEENLQYSEDDADPTVTPIFNDVAKFGHVRLELGMEFATKDAFKKGVRNYTLQEGRGVRYKKNDTTRCRMVCKNEDCPWMVFCSYSKPNRYWQIKTFNDDHTCERTFKNRCATRSWVTDVLVKKVRKLPTFRHYAHETPVRGSQERTAIKLKRKYGKFTCGTCGDVGHTTKSCKIAKKQKADELAAATKAAEDAANEDDAGAKGDESEVVSAECEIGAEGGQTETQTEVAAEGV
ncbi:hypothetical protein Ahy_B02g058401 [Arachis hypogaea]|uniref:Transposase MuDR plant domain-containing protein n=1 Tax=Arachis hypogaea TaxID=3818 RepID=A0A445AEK8_ARAHY|nr:hypothetical protein Ahy_B02g058401 [Arachis hypogaea]